MSLIKKIWKSITGNYPLYGKAKALDDIIAGDVIDYPIWVYAIGQEDFQDQDESWQQPVINTKDVTEDIIEPIITFKIEVPDRIGTATYDHDEQKLYGFSIWHDEDSEWKLPDQMSDLISPAILTAVPTINGVTDVKFIVNDWAEDEATATK